MPTLLIWPIDEHWPSKHEQHKMGAYVDIKWDQSTLVGYSDPW